MGKQDSCESETTWLEKENSGNSSSMNRWHLVFSDFGNYNPIDDKTHAYNNRNKGLNKANTNNTFHLTGQVQTTDFNNALDEIRQNMTDNKL